MKNLRVGINARLLADGSMRGWNRYAVNLISSMAKTGEVEIVLLSDQPLAANFRSVFESQEFSGTLRTELSGPMFYPKWQEFWLPKIVKQLKIQVLHTPYHFGLPLFSACPTVATLHDAIDVCQKRSLRDYVDLRSIRSRFYLGETRSRASRIITVSNFSAGELRERLGIKPSRIRTIYEAADPQIQLPDRLEMESVLGHYGLERNGYVFYVGGLEHRKNLGLLIEALSGIRSDTSLRVVIAGGSAGDTAVLRQLAESLGVTRRVQFLGKVADIELSSLYGGALALVYPSRHEGFGLQLVEAMAVGCPILASTSASLPEILGQGGATFPADDAKGLGRLLIRLEQDQEWRMELAIKSKHRGLDFRWEKTARETIGVYRECV